MSRRRDYPLLLVIIGGGNVCRSISYDLLPYDFSHLQYYDQMPSLVLSSQFVSRLSLFSPHLLFLRRMTLERKHVMIIVARMVMMIMVMRVIIVIEGIHFRSGCG